MIPTRFKAKLPTGLSFPVSAKAISDAFADAPHLELCQLHFSSEAIWPGAAFRRILKEQTPYGILEARFVPPIASGYGMHAMDPSLVMTVCPVTSDLRHVANRLLEGTGLRAVARWWLSSKSTGWMDRQHQFNVVFDPKEEALLFRTSDGA